MSSMPQYSRFMYKNSCDSMFVGETPFRRFVITCPEIEKKRSHILDVGGRNLVSMRTDSFEDTEPRSHFAAR